MFRILGHLSRFIIDFDISFQSFSIRKSHFFHSFFFFWQLMQCFLKTFASLTSETTFAPRYMNYKNHCRNSWSEISLMKYVISRTSFHLRQKINWKKICSSPIKGYQIDVQWILLTFKRLLSFDDWPFFLQLSPVRHAYYVKKSVNHYHSTSANIVNPTFVSIFDQARNPMTWTFWKKKKKNM